MTLDDFNQVVQFSGLSLETHDFHVAYFSSPLSDQQFLDHAAASIIDFTGVWFRIQGSAVYFAVENTAIVPDDFALELIKVVATEPLEE